MIRRHALKTIAACAGWTGVSAIFGACSEKGPTFTSIDITGANYARDFVLTDHNGQRRSLTDFAGKVVVVFFGYVQCADVCPATMAELADVKRLLGAQGSLLQALFITVDPARDTPAVLKAYMANFDPTFLALYTTPEQLEALAKEFRIFYKKVPGATATSYTVDHSAGSYVYDQQGRIRLYTSYGTAAALLAGDIRQLLSLSV